MQQWTLRYTLSLFLILLSLPLVAAIEPMHSVTQLSSLELGEGEVKILVAFDIDDTLTILNEPAFHRPNFKLHHAEVFAHLMVPLSKEEQLVAFTLPLLTTSGVLLENQTPQVIQQLQNKGAKTLALTAAMAGKIEETSIEDRRISELNRVGINFSSSFPDIGETIFTNFPTPIIGSYPLFKEGIIFTNENDKGKVLVEFLKNISWRPSCIVFVDDRIDHLHAVEKALNHFFPEIQFQGYHFQTDPRWYVPVDATEFQEKWSEHITLAKEILHSGRKYFRKPRREFND